MYIVGEFLDGIGAFLQFVVNKKSALGTDEILKINLERLSLSLIWVQILHRALLIQSDCALILCRLIDRQGRKRSVVISVSYLWCLHVGFAFFIEGKPGRGREPGGGKRVDLLY